MKNSKRSYDSSGRRQQAEKTRRKIASAARKLFIRKGYAATSVKAIAKEAGVAEPTIYTTFGSKKAILIALADAIDLEAGVIELVENLRTAAGDPARQLDLSVGYEKRLYGQSSDFIDAAYKAGGADQELAKVLKLGRGRAREGKSRLIQDWTDAGILKPDLKMDEAIDVFVTLCSNEVYRLLVLESGWSPDRYEEWLSQTLRLFLFADPIR